MSKEYEKQRLRAKELGISNWHNKKLENLEVEIAQVTGMSFGDDLAELLDKVEQVAEKRLQPTYDALDTLSSRYYGALVDTFDDLLWKQRPSPGDVLQIHWLTQKINVSCKRRYSPSTIRTFLEAVCVLNAHLGWAINDDLIILGPKKPMFNVRWQINLWNHKSQNSSMITRLLAVTQGEH